MQFIEAYICQYITFRSPIHELCIHHAASLILVIDICYTLIISILPGVYQVRHVTKKLHPQHRGHHNQTTLFPQYQALKIPTCPTTLVVQLVVQFSFLALQHCWLMPIDSRTSPNQHHSRLNKWIPMTHMGEGQGFHVFP